MGKTVVISIIVAVVFAGLGFWGGLYYSGQLNPQPQPTVTVTTTAGAQTVKVTSDDNNKTVTLTTKDTLQITLDNPGDGGYTFQDPTFDATALQSEGHTHQDPTQSSTTSPIVGNFGTDTWTFQPLKAGQSTLTITAKRTASGETITSLTIQVNVTG